MSDSLTKPRQIWLRSFYGFSPQNDGYIGWTEEGPRDRMLGLIQSGDLFMIYGAASTETAKSSRNRILGFLQVEARPILDREKSSTAGLERKRSKGWEHKWGFAIPVVRAWEADEAVLLERVAPKTYRPEAGQAIAVWSPPLLPSEIELALKVKVKEVSVYGEAALLEAPLKAVPLAKAFLPSQAFPSTAGKRAVEYTDGPTRLYLARFEGSALTLLRKPPSNANRSSLMKIGISNDVNRRICELNSGFSPSVLDKWTMKLISEPYVGHKAAEYAEEVFKSEACGKLECLRGEFFWGDWTSAQLLFSAIPGVSRFGGSS